MSVQTDNMEVNKVRKSSVDTVSKKANRKSPADNKEVADNAVGEVMREERIAIAAYYLAEKRGFHSADAMQNWIDAEKEIDGNE